MGTSESLPAGIPVVVVDSTALAQTQGDVGRSAWPAAHGAARLGLFEFALPSVVLLEVVNHRRLALEKLSKDAESLHRDRVRLLGADDDPISPPSTTRESIPALLARYTEELRTYFGANGVTMEHPTVTHGELVSRLLAGRKPFSSGERGYRDSLIWYTVLDLAKSRDVLLLSNNTRDFGDGDKLASELEEELLAHGASGRVTLCTSLAGLLQRVLPAEWSQDQLASAWTSFATSGQFLAELERWFEANGALPFSSRPALFPATMWETDIEAIDRVEDSSLLAAVDDGDGWHQVVARLRCVGHPGGMIWNRRWTWSHVPRDEFELWSEFGPHQDYVRTVAEHDLEVQVNARFRAPTELEDLRLSDVRVLGDDRSASERRDPQMPLDQRLVALSDEINDLLELVADEPDVYADLIGHDNYVISIARTLQELAAIADGVPPALAPDNLDSVLGDPTGIAALRRDIAEVIRSRQAP